MGSSMSVARLRHAKTHLGATGVVVGGLLGRRRSSRTRRRISRDWL